MPGKANIVLGACLILGAGMLVMLALRQGGGANISKPTVVSPHLVTAVIAKAEITRGEQIAADRLTTLQVDTLPPGVFASPQAATGAVALQNIAVGQFIGNFNAARAANGQAGLSMLVPAGMRAVALRITDEVAVGNFIRSGDRVDILLRLTPTSNSNAQTRNLSAITVDRQSILLLQSVEVLSVGNDLNARSTQDALRARTVTIAVTPEDAGKLNLVGELGSFYLALRNPLDDKPSPAQQVRIADLLAPVEAVDQQGAAHNAPRKPPRDHSVSVISGGVTSETLFRHKGE